MWKFPSRHYSRDLAFKTVFILSERKDADADEVFDYNADEFFPEIKDRSFAKEIVDSSLKNREKNRKWISEFASSFDLDKTNPVDVIIIELLITEIYYLKEPTPIPVAINEALELVSEYWKEGSGSFVNWVIAKIIKKYETAPKKN